MEPVKRDGKVREQVDVENEVRRMYPIKWGPMTEKHLYNFYNPTKINQEIKKKFNDVQKCPYKYTGDGDSHFVSKAMYNSLVSICRCGREKTEGHILKCLQKVKNIHLTDLDDSVIDDDVNDDDDDRGGNVAVDKIKKKEKFIKPLPKTSAGMVGWPNSKYKTWEKMTYYISPKNTMPEKVTDHPYGSIFIG